jgi:hypothetical protein
MDKDIAPTLPPIHSAPVLFLRFTSKASPSIIDFEKDRLVEEGIIVFAEKDDSNNNIIFGLTVTQPQLDKEAERCELPKPCALVNVKGALEMFEGVTVVRPFMVANRDLFQKRLHTNDEVRKQRAVAYCSEGIFTSADRIKILFSELESLPVLKPGSSTSNLARIMNEDIQVSIDEIARKHNYPLPNFKSYNSTEPCCPC